MLARFKSIRERDIDERGLETMRKSFFRLKRLVFNCSQAWKFAFVFERLARAAKKESPPKSLALKSLSLKHIRALYPFPENRVESCFGSILEISPLLESLQVEFADECNFEWYFYSLTYLAVSTVISTLNTFFH
jgi:hypothetical protein